jgi:hypothetical protein
LTPDIDASIYRITSVVKVAAHQGKKRKAESMAVIHRNYRVFLPICASGYFLPISIESLDRYKTTLWPQSAKKRPRMARGPDRSTIGARSTNGNPQQCLPLLIRPLRMKF